jgi:hypothetical protein
MYSDSCFYGCIYMAESIENWYLQNGGCVAFRETFRRPAKCSEGSNGSETTFGEKHDLQMDPVFYITSEDTAAPTAKLHSK